MTAALLTPSFTKSLLFKLILFSTIITCFLLLKASIAFAAEGDLPVTEETPPNSTTPAIEPVTAANYGPDKHILFTLMNMGGYAAGCLGEGTPLFGGSCLDMVGSVGPNGQTQAATPYLVDSSIRSGGALGALGNAMIALGTTRPTSPVQYLASVGENFGIKPAYAQVTGSGSTVIEPILKIWQLTRNIAYFGFILIFMVIGFMIMFRQKLNPQTVISAQNALPGVVVALILVTFSYLIAALIIDLGFITTQITGRLLVANGLANQTNIDETLANRNLFDMFGSFISPSGNDVDQVASTVSGSVGAINHGFVAQIMETVVAAGGCYFGSGLGSNIGTSIAEGVNSVPIAGPGKFLAIHAGTIGKGIGCVGGGAAGYAAVKSGAIFYGLGVVLYVVLLIALLIAMGRTFFELIKAYVTIMIQTVIGPIIILTGAIPGQGGSFSGWAKTILANVLIFPAVFSAFFFAAFIKGNPEQTFGIPLQVAGDFSKLTSTVPLLGGLTGQFIQLILAYGVLLIIPSIPGEVKKAFKVQDSALGGAALSQVAGGFALGRSTVSRAISPYQKEIQATREARLKRKAEQWTATPNAPLPADAPWYLKVFGRR